MTGLTDTGFQSATFDEIKEDIEDTMTTALGPLDFRAESVLGQVTGIFTERELFLWQALEAVYNAMYPSTASGFSLDGVAAYTGVVRLASTPTKVDVSINGADQTTIISGSELSALGVSTNFRIDDTYKFNATSCLAATVEVLNDTGASYDILINSINHQVIPFFGDTIGAIMAEMVDVIEASTLNLTATPDYDNNTIAIEHDALMAISVSVDMQINDLSDVVNFTAATTGSIGLPANMLINIVTPVFGWNSAINLSAGITGRDLETDTELRLRRSESLRIPGAGTPEAIRSNVANLPGVISVSVIENTSLVVVDSRPPKSFETLVLGGEDLDIANMIWLKRPAGIETYGSTTVLVNDSEGVPQSVSFSRPVELFIYATVTLTLNGSGAYPLDGDDIIKAGIVKQINDLAISNDVIYQSLFSSVYSVNGIATATVEIGATLNEFTPPAQSSANIAVGSAEIAVTDLTKMTIVTI